MVEDGNYIAEVKSDLKEVGKKRKRVNVRRPEVMELVEAEVARHYQSSTVEKIKNNGGELTIGNTTVYLAQSFGFCYGVERAIDLAYAARRVFADNRIFLIGEIIHNPEVNEQLDLMGVIRLPWRHISEEYDDIGEEDVVIVPAFGAPLHFMDKVERQGAQIIDTTCGDVMKVWRRVRGYAKDGVTSIIHGKAQHEETLATASRALGDEGNGNYLIILTMDDARYLCDFLVNGGDSQAFLERFAEGVSPGFDPQEHLRAIGVANQTTMLKSETEAIQQLLREAICKRDGDESNYHMFDTICGATQERQDALFELLKKEMDLLFVVGGYNSSNTSHLVEIGEKELPSFFIRNSECLHSLEEILHYDLTSKEETRSNYAEVFTSARAVSIGVTAGASCPPNLIEQTILRLFELRGIAKDEVLSA